MVKNQEDIYSECIDESEVIRFVFLRTLKDKTLEKTTKEKYTYLEFNDFMTLFQFYISIGSPVLKYMFVKRDNRCHMTFEHMYFSPEDVSSDRECIKRTHPNAKFVVRDYIPEPLQTQANCKRIIDGINFHIGHVVKALTVLNRDGKYMVRIAVV